MGNGRFSCVRRGEEKVLCFWVLAAIGGSLVRVLKRVVFGVFICVLALGGGMVGTIHGAIKGQTTETGFFKGAVIGGLAGAIAAVQLLDFTVDGEPLSKAALLGSLVSGKVFMDFVSPAMLKAYQWQVSSLETSYRENSDIYDIASIKGLSKISIQKLPSLKYHHSSELLSQEFSCSICLQKVKEKDSVRRLPKCGHFFHLDCIDQWLLRQGSCPMCRTHICNETNELYCYFC
ncbi:hypothetical protein UlMin_019461 [Ulmus minor]